MTTKAARANMEMDVDAKALPTIRGPSSDRISPRRSTEFAVSTKLNSILTAVGS